jgi:hypothetical protein
MSGGADRVHHHQRDIAYRADWLVGWSIAVSVIVGLCLRPGSRMCSSTGDGVICESRTNECRRGVNS